ncbi:MAG: nuclear transport factor 2 family protein [Chloroflexi bacterium]|nr:nuclear transport factor 2 family protein [Chloroflexota bacterium]
MDQQQVQQLAQHFIDALHTLEQGNVEHADQLAGMYSDDARVINAALKLAGQERTGQDGARQFWTEYRRTFGEAYSEFYQVTVNEQAAGLFWTTKGTGNDGQPMEYDGVSLLVFDDQGKIKLFRGYYDTRELSREVGANPQPGTKR